MNTEPREMQTKDEQIREMQTKVYVPVTVGGKRIMMRPLMYKEAEAMVDKNKLNGWLK